MRAPFLLALTVMVVNEEKMKQRLKNSLLGAALLLSSSAVMADERFTIKRFQIEGNTLLSAAQIEQILHPMSGPDRDYADVQRALEAMEAAYQKAGYSAVQVYVPEQELTEGVVVFKVTEGAIGNVKVTGNKYFDEDNIRAGLPMIKNGAHLKLNAVSAGTQLVNDNPAKQVSVLLSANEDTAGQIDAEIKVDDYKPLRVLFSLDNTGASSTGKWRTGVALQHANLFNRDQVATLAYTTSPDSPKGVSVNMYSFGYRLPLYGLGDSLDFIYGKSSTDTPGSLANLTTALGFTGKGDIYGLRWNHFFGRRDDAISKLVFGIDHKNIDSRCNINGIAISTAPPTPPIAACVPYVTMPLSVTYSKTIQGNRQSIDYSIGIARNWATGVSYTNPVDKRVDRYSYLTPGSRSTTDNFIVVRGGASIFKGYTNDWQMRLAGSAQYAKDPLVSAEQFGLAGANAVRGFTERAVTADSGVIINAELYSPEISNTGKLRLLAFYDIARGYNSKVGSSGIFSSTTLSSVGVGARYVWGRDLSVKLDLARVGIAGASAAEHRGDLNAHVSAIVGF